MIKTHKFLIDQYVDGVDTVKLTDKRNYIECYGFDASKDKVIDLYINYIRLLNGMKNQWKSWGYLDFGLVPVVMAPSFIHTAIKETIVDRLGLLGIEFHLLPSMSFLTGEMNNVVGDTDVWVSREVISEVMDIPVNQVTVEKFIRWCCSDESERYYQRSRN